VLEQETSFTSEGFRISGTLALPSPEGRFACVLMIPGSGRVDRNENLKRLPINVFGELSQHFAERGIASYRYDKRGVGQSGGDYWKKGFDDSLTDAIAALSSLQSHPRIRTDEIFALGHSEGAYVVMRLAADGAAKAAPGASIGQAAVGPGLAGAVLIAGGARSGEEELKWQAVQVVAGITGFNRWLIKLLRIDPIKMQQKHLQKIKNSTEDSYRIQLFNKVNAKWMREFLAYDPLPDLAKISVPVLAITGAKDIQVSPDNLPRMAEIVTAPFEYHIVPDVTHLLRSEAGRPSISTYKKQVRRPIDPRVVELLLDWLERQIST
jgi:uncharacterized protein